MGDVDNTQEETEKQIKFVESLQYATRIHEISPSQEEQRSRLQPQARAMVAKLAGCDVEQIDCEDYRIAHAQDLLHAEFSEMSFNWIMANMPEVSDLDGQEGRIQEKLNLDLDNVWTLAGTEHQQQLLTNLKRRLRYPGKGLGNPAKRRQSRQKPMDAISIIQRIAMMFADLSCTLNEPPPPQRGIVPRDIEIIPGAIRVQLAGDTEGRYWLCFMTDAVKNARQEHDGLVLSGIDAAVMHAKDGGEWKLYRCEEPHSQS